MATTPHSTIIDEDIVPSIRIGVAAGLAALRGLAELLHALHVDDHISHKVRDAVLSNINHEKGIPDSAREGIVEAVQEWFPS